MIGMHFVRLHQFEPVDVARTELQVLVLHGRNIHQQRRAIHFQLVQRLAKRLRFRLFHFERLHHHQLADGKLMVVKSFEVKEPKTKPFREALDKLKVDGTTLLVDISTVENKNLELSSRNIDGLELVKANEVHPYHLMRYTHVVFAQPALEKLQDSLKKSATRRQHEAEPAEEKKTKVKKKPAPRLRKTKAEVA